MAHPQVSSDNGELYNRLTNYQSLRGADGAFLVASVVHLRVHGRRAILQTKLEDSWKIIYISLLTLRKFRSMEETVARETSFRFYSQETFRVTKLSCGERYK